MNILVDIWGNALLCDFGLSRIRHEVSRTLTVIRAGGRSFFVAPEVYKEEIRRPTESSDIYSFSITIYVLGTGKYSLFNGLEGPGRQTALLAMSGLRPPCPDYLGGLDNDNTELLYRLLGSMWASDPETRPTAGYVKSVLLSISVTLGSNFYGIVPAHQNDAKSHKLVLRLIKDYQWDNAGAGVWLIRSLHPWQSSMMIAELITSAMSPLVAEARKARVNHIIAVILLAQDQRVLLPALFYLGIKDFLSRTGAVRLDHGGRFQDVAALLFAMGVSRFRVVEVCKHKDGEGRAIVEYWDSIHREKQKPHPVIASFVSYMASVQSYSFTGANSCL